MKNEDHLYIKSIFRYKFNSLLSKIFVSYISIILVMVIANLTTYHYVQHVLLEKETDASKDYLNYVSRTVDGELIHVRERMYGLLKNPDSINYLSNIEEDINSQINIINALLNFKNNSQMVSEALLYNKKLPFVIGNNGTESKSDFLSQLNDSLNADSDNITKSLDLSKDFRMIPRSSVITLVTGASYTADNNRLIVTINERDINNVITNTNIVSYGSVYMVDRKGTVISSSEKAKPGGILDIDLMAKIHENQNGVTFNFQKSLVVYAKSKFFDGYYITVIPNHIIFKKIVTIRTIFNFALFMLVVIGLFFAGMYSRIFYHPVLTLMNKFKASKTVDKHYKDEFAFISGFVENIMTRNHKYEEDHVLGRMMEAESYSEEIRNIFPYRSFQVAVVTCYASSKLLAFVQDYIGRHAFGECVLKATIGTDGDCYLVANGNLLETQGISEYLHGLKKDIEGNHHLFTVIGIGPICHHFSDIGLSLKNARTAIQQGNGFDETCMFAYSDQAKETHRIYFTLDFENRIMDALILGSEEKVISLIDHIFEQNRELPQLYMKMIYTKFVDTYIMIVGKYNLKYNIQEITENVEHEFRADHVKKFISKLYLELVSLVYVPQEDTSKRVESFIVEHIERNYFNGDMTIEEISDQLNLSSSYVSTLFKKSTGKTFSQYLLDYRMNKAMELLLHTDYSVKEISSKVGSGTYNSFIRSFRSIVGVSPGEYRSIHKVKLL